jgi:hypothetical protein
MVFQSSTSVPSPWRARTRFSDSSVRSASRSVLRLVPSLSESSRSGGSRLPGGWRPSKISRRSRSTVVSPRARRADGGKSIGLTICSNG